MVTVPHNSYGWYTASAMPATSQSQRRLTWWQTYQKNRPQSQSIAGGLLLLASGGLHLAFSLWEPLVQLPAAGESPGMHLTLLAALHVTAIGGGCLGAALLTRWRKRTIYFLCALLQCIANSLCIGLPNSLWTLLVARLLIGVAHGICYVCIVQHAGDNTARQMRGRVLSHIGTVLALATCVYVGAETVHAYYNRYATDADGLMLLDTDGIAGSPTARLGIAALTLTLCGVVVVACLCRESVLFLMRHPVAGDADDTEAIATMMRLRGESTLTASVYQELMELKQMVLDDLRLSAIISHNGNTRPLLLLAAMRAVHWATNNVLLNAIMVPAQAYAGQPQLMIDLDTPAQDLRSFGPLLLVVMRTVFTAAAALSADRIRRRFMAVQTFGGAAVLLAVALLLTLLADRHWPFAIIYLGLFGVAQAFFGWADSVPHVVAAEAFALSKKPWSVAFAASVEHSLHIGALVVYFALPVTLLVHTLLLYIFGGVLAVAVIVVFWHMPEALGMSLPQCRDKYRGVIAGGIVYSRAYSANLQREQAYKISVY